MCRIVTIPLYAKNGIPEVWLLDVQNRQLEIYREPANGAYRQRDACQSGFIAPILCPDASIDLAELIPPRLNDRFAGRVIFIFTAGVHPCNF
ncbi:MAG: Uma2 family endonuclease [Candidatus Competibacter sp.]